MSVDVERFSQEIERADFVRFILDLITVETTFELASFAYMLRSAGAEPTDIDGIYEIFDEAKNYRPMSRFDENGFWAIRPKNEEFGSIASPKIPLSRILSIEFFTKNDDGGPLKPTSRWIQEDEKLIEQLT